MTFSLVENNKLVHPLILTGARGGFCVCMCVYVCVCGGGGGGNNAGNKDIFISPVAFHNNIAKLSRI